MKLKHTFLTAGFLLPLCYGLTVQAKDAVKLADEVETPDILIQQADDKKEQVRYGDDDIKLSPNGPKDNAQITPDPLERNLMPKETKEAVEKKKKEEKKIIEKKPVKKPAPANDDILTPDPLLDMVN